MKEIPIYIPIKPPIKQTASTNCKCGSRSLLVYSVVEYLIVINAMSFSSDLFSGKTSFST